MEISSLSNALHDTFAASEAFGRLCVRDPRVEVAWRDLSPAARDWTAPDRHLVAGSQLRHFVRVIGRRADALRAVNADDTLACAYRAARQILSLTGANEEGAN